MASVVGGTRSVAGELKETGLKTAHNIHAYASAHADNTHTAVSLWVEHWAY